VSVKLKASVTLVALVIPFPVPPAGYKTIPAPERSSGISVFISSNRVDTSTPLRTLSPSHSNDVGSDEKPGLEPVDDAAYANPEKRDSTTTTHVMN
jgi:hypothetical protein